MTTKNTHPLSLEVKLQTKSGVQCQVDWYPVFQGQSSKGAYQGVLKKLSESGAFDGAFKSSQFIRFAGEQGAEHAYFIGCGAAGEATEEKMRQLGGLGYSRLIVEKAKSVRVNLDGIPANKRAKLGRALVEGFVLRCYEFRKYKTKGEKESKLGSIVIVASDAKSKNELSRHVAALEATHDAVTLTRDWSNEPSNEGTPQYFASEAKRIAASYGIKCTVLTEAEIRKQKMNLFLAVGQGSERENRLVVLEYAPKGAKNAKGLKTVALVGKGVTFDSGGISIKPSLRMEDMKHDMTGAATLFGATLLASKLKVKKRVVTVLAFTENMPSGTAVQPGNIVTARSGKTVEIINTDAEGRLALADALDYAQDFKPDAIIDAATLTGAVAVALGKHACGILGNDDGLIRALQKCGDSTGERMWQLPLFDEYFEDMKSEYADMKNSVNDSYGGTIRGAIFLKQFIRPGVKWAHLDIASTAWDMGHLPYYPRRGASGAYVRAVARFIESF